MSISWLHNKSIIILNRKRSCLDVVLVDKIGLTDCPTINNYIIMDKKNIFNLDNGFVSIFSESISIWDMVSVFLFDVVSQYFHLKCSSSHDY